MKKVFRILMVGLILLVAMTIVNMTDEIAWADEADADNIEIDVLPELYIKAVNPGYTIDGKSNVGEMIEIAKRSSDPMISLAGITVRYTNSSGNSTTLYEFPESSYLAGESILLRLASSEGSELAAIKYSKTLAMKAGLELIRDEKVVDAVCWTGKKGCYKEFVSSKPTTLVRNVETGQFEHFEKYEPVYDEKAYLAEEKKNDEETEKVSRCRKVVFSEVLSYYEALQSEQFVELYNAGSEQVMLDGCEFRYKNKLYAISGIIKPEEYYVYYPTSFALTKNPTNSNTLELVDADGSVVDKLIYPNGQRKGTSYALIGYDQDGAEIWRQTYAPTPGTANNYQEFRTCESGKVINEATGNCVKVTSVMEKICGEGQYLNPLTGRCKKIESEKEKTCKEGYYLNPETGRCRKIVENKSADYAIRPEEYEESSSFVGLYALIGVLAVGAGILIFEFRHQLMGLCARIIRR